MNYVGKILKTVQIVLSFDVILDIKYQFYVYIMLL